MTTKNELIKAKLNLPDLTENIGNVGEACRRLAYSRYTFCRVSCARAGPDCFRADGVRYLDLPAGVGYVWLRHDLETMKK